MKGYCIYLLWPQPKPKRPRKGMQRWWNSIARWMIFLLFTGWPTYIYIYISSILTNCPPYGTSPTSFIYLEKINSFPYKILSGFYHLCLCLSVLIMMVLLKSWEHSIFWVSFRKCIGLLSCSPVEDFHKPRLTKKPYTTQEWLSFDPLHGACALWYLGKGSVLAFGWLKKVLEVRTSISIGLEVGTFYIQLAAT